MQQHERSFAHQRHVGKVLLVLRQDRGQVLKRHKACA